jgi:hypothetical protein
VTTVVTGRTHRHLPRPLAMRLHLHADYIGIHTREAAELPNQRSIILETVHPAQPGSPNPRRGDGDPALGALQRPRQPWRFFLLDGPEACLRDPDQGR